ncbi:polysaccharide biosynthesis/export family protein [Paraburkholderia terrae]
MGFMRKRPGIASEITRHSLMRPVISVVLSVALSACAVAPGMRMSAPATLPGGSGASNGPASEAQVPITDIDINLIQQIRDTDTHANEDAVRQLFARAEPYTLGVSDVLQVTVWDHPELAAALGAQPQTSSRPYDPGQGFVIDTAGNIQLPYAGSVHVAGLRIDEAQRAIHAALSTMYVKPQVTVRVASYRAKQVYVDGELRMPGAIPINDSPMTLYEAITRAGGFSSSADQSRMVVVRNGVSYPLSLPHMLERGQNPANVLLRDGDLLRVASRDDYGVFVMGEVNKPVTAIPMKTGKLTLSEAMSQAGSLNNATADAAQLYVIRGVAGNTPQVYHLDAHSPVAMVLANQFELHPKDVVYVDGNGLVRFSRVLNLLLPAINAGLTAAILTK